MAITVEDGSIVTGANSYVSVAELTTFAANRGITFTGDSEILIHKSMDYLEQLAFIGDKLTEAQPLQWPRGFAEIDGYIVDTTEIPQLLKNAQLTICVAIGEGYDPLSPVSRAVKREKVDVIEVEYMDGSASVDYARTVTNSLKKLIRNGGGVSVWRG